MFGYVDEEPMFKPSALIRKPVENFPKTVIVTWHSKVLDSMNRNFCMKTVGHNGPNFPIYAFDCDSKRLGFALIALGGPFVAQFIEECREMGARRFVFLGSCGVLKKVNSSIIVPDAALRDEGTSWHYIEDEDEFISIPSATETAAIISSVGAEVTTGATWTTDAVYRETPSAAEEARELGCICVDMECASIAAVCRAKNIDFNQFFFTGDKLDKSTWDPGTLLSETKGSIDAYTSLAVYLAKTVTE